MPTPKIVLMHDGDDGHADGEAEGVDDVRVLEDPAQVVEAVAEGVLHDQRQRPGHQEEEVGGHDEPEHVGDRPAAPGGQAGAPAGIEATAAASSATAHQPPLQEVDGDDHDEGDEQEHAGDRGGGLDVVVLDAAQDPHRRDLGLEREVAGQQHERPVLADRRGRTRAPPRRRWPG